MSTNWRSGGGRILSHVLKVTELEFDPCWNFRDKAQDFQTYSKRASANDRSQWQLREPSRQMCCTILCWLLFSLALPTAPKFLSTLLCCAPCQGPDTPGVSLSTGCCMNSVNKRPYQETRGWEEREDVVFLPNTPPSPCFHTMSITIAEYFLTTVSSTNPVRTGSSKHHTLSLPLRPWVVLIYPCCLFFGWFNFPSFFPWTLHTLW